MNIRAFEIIRREFLERVKKKSFWISTILFPVMILGFTVLPAFLGRVSLQKDVKIAVIDRSGKSFEEFARNLTTHPEPGEKADGKGGTPAEPRGSYAPPTLVPVPEGKTLETVLDGIKKRIGDGEFEGCVVIPKELEEPETIEYYGKSVSNINLLRDIQSAIDPIVLKDRLERNQVPATIEQIRQWVRSLPLETSQVEKGGTSKKSGFLSAFMMTFVFVFILYMALIIYGIANLRGVLEEKTSRIMEILLSTFTPRQIMTGKLVGIGMVGLTQMGVYALCMLGMLVYSAVSAATLDPSIAQTLANFNPIYLLYFIIFFVLGYFIYSALFLGIGSLCSSEEDAQNLQSVVMIPIIIPMVLTMFFINNPDAMLTRIVSQVPLFTPLVMLMRVMVQTPPWWEIWLSIVLSVAFLFLTMWAVAKVFRVGVLMYGKRPSFAEVIRWFRSA